MEKREERYEREDDYLDIEDRVTVEELQVDGGTEGRKELEDKILSKFKEEFSRMDSSRKSGGYEADRDTCDGQMEANTYYDDQGRLQVNPPLEEDLVELACGRMAGKLDYNLESVGKQTVVQDIVVAKAALAHYLRSEDFHNTLKESRRGGATYGTAIGFTGVIQECNVMYKISPTADVESKSLLWDTEYDEYKEYNYLFTGKDVDLREFWLDENSLKNNNIQKADKCVMKEAMSLERFKLKFGDDVFKGVDDIESGIADVDPSHGEAVDSPDMQVIVHYYFNKVTKDMWIIANNAHLIFAGKMTNKSGRLPFVSKHHYTNHKSFYGRGICHKVRYLKAYKAELLQDLLDQSRMGGINIFTGNDNVLSDDRFVSPSNINIMKFAGDMSNVNPMEYKPDIAKYQVILDLLDNLVIQDTGENLKGTYQAVAEQLGTVEIIENSRMTRLATVDENDDLFISAWLTAALDNITQYAYKLQSKTTKSEEGDIETVEYPVIQVKDAKVKQGENGDVEIVYEMGEDGFFEFRENMIQGRYLVKVVTNSNVNTQRTLEKNSLTQYINNLGTLAAAFPGALQEEDVESLKKLMKMIYDYDDKYMVDTRRDQIQKEAVDLMKKIQQSVGLNIDQNNNEVTQQNTQSIPPAVQLGQGGGQASPAGQETVAGGLNPPGGMPNVRGTNKGSLI